MGKRTFTPNTPRNQNFQHSDFVGIWIERLNFEISRENSPSAPKNMRNEWFISIRLRNKGEKQHYKPNFVTLIW